jgi:N-methylhydantoinase A
MCYGRGGTEPTVTDAHLVLGRIPPHLLGGAVPLDERLAREGLERLGSRLGLGVGALAEGILEISAWNQANALRQITVQRGLDVRDFALTTFGGSGSLLLCRLLDIVGVPVGVVPRDPGNLSAFGLLTVDVKVDHVQTALHRDIATVFAELRARAAQESVSLSADLRYHGQAFEVRVPVPNAPFDQAVADATVATFHDAHERLYGYCFRDKPEQRVEWVNLRVTGVGRIPRPALALADVGPMPEPTGVRPVSFEKGYVDTPIYWRGSLGEGARVEGPAVIEEYGATVPLHPGFSATVDRYGNLVVER